MAERNPREVTTKSRVKSATRLEVLPFGDQRLNMCRAKKHLKHYQSFVL